MTRPDTDTSHWSAADRFTAFAGGAAFMTSGTSLAVHIVTGAPLPLVLAALIAAATAILIGLFRTRPETRRVWAGRIRAGAVAGLVATAAYDLSRLLLVNVLGWKASPFAAFPLFGQALFGDTLQGNGRIVAGVAFHLMNGIAFGVAYTQWFGRRPWWTGILFALGLEAFMLALYPGWLSPKSLAEFASMSVLGHVAYGTVLGLSARSLRRRWQT
jgi:hypothetical protein